MPKAGVWRASKKTAVRAIRTNAIPISFEPLRSHSKPPLLAREAEAENYRRHRFDLHRTGAGADHRSLSPGRAEV
jgi:hypothetical protein